MEKEKISFQHKNGIVEGVYINAADASPLVIIVNGHNGFYNYGMFPYIQQKLYEKSISSYSFNFSHGGVRGEADHFEDLEKYEQNCMRLETEDLVCVLRNLNNQFKNHSKVYLLAHSLGVVPTIFATKTAIKEKLNLDGIILVSTVKTLNFWSPEILKEWALAGTYYIKNNRTKQELPQGFEFLQEILKSENEWNVKKGIQSLSIPILIIHGANDEAVSVEHGESLYSWIKTSNPHASLKILENATHTFNTKHPFEKTSIELEELIKITVDWIFKHN
jgi:pimeloyl-ACP methyl ester carboxylesterase